MTLPHACAECGEKDNIDVSFVAYVNGIGEPSYISIMFTCGRCGHQWLIKTYDFNIVEDV